jgi:long-chain acyl-CoA synthetase
MSTELSMHTIDSVIRESCRKYSDKAALRHKTAGVWREITYSELWEQSDRIAAGLIRSGFKPGHHGALLAPSSPDWVAAYLGILKAGGVVIPVDKELKSVELRHILTDSDTRVLFTAPPCLDLVLDLIRDIPVLERVVTMVPGPEIGDSELSRAMEALQGEWHDLIDSGKLPPEQTGRIEALAHQVLRLINASAVSKWKHHEIADHLGPAEPMRRKLVREGKLLTLDDLYHSAPLPEKPRKPEDTAVILYTSGTTGRSKGAMLSHSNIVFNIQGAITHFKLDSSIHTLSFLPINHVFEQVCGVLLPLVLGGTVSFCESLKKLGENLTEVRPTFLLGVPAVYRMLLDRIMKGIGTKRLSRALFSLPLTRPIVTAKVRRRLGGTIFISGGAYLDPAIARGLIGLGLDIYQGYGITETSPIISAEQPGATRPGTVGHLLNGVEVRIDNPSDEKVGEILVRGPNVMQGYYKNSQATSEVLVAGGWYRTGDLGRFDEEGYLSICGRVKNLIVTPNGKNVYPEEVENELLKSSFIAEAMVYGHRSEQGTEEVHAMIYPDQEALDDHCRSKELYPMNEADVEVLLRAEVLKSCSALADYKRVRKFTIREDEFPKTTTRKIKRFEVDAGISTES